MKRATREMYEPAIGQVFETEGPNGPYQLTLEKVFADPGKNSGEFVHLKLVFRGPDDQVLPQAIYDLENETVGSRRLFMVPVSSRGGQVEYEVFINYSKDPGFLEEVNRKHRTAREAAMAQSTVVEDKPIPG